MGPAVVAVTTVAVVACGGGGVGGRGGGGGGGGDAEERDFLAKAYAVCARARVAELRTPLPDRREEAKAFNDALRKGNRALFDRLRDLDGPEATKKRLRRALDRGLTNEAAQALAALGLDTCARRGVAALAGGDLYVYETRHLCAGSVREIQNDLDFDRPATAREAADELRVLARGLTRTPPPRRAAHVAEAAAAELEATADGLDDLARGRLDRAALDRSTMRGAAALFLLNLADCNDVYPALTGERRG